MVQSVERALQVLEALAGADQEMTLAQVQHAVGLSPSTSHRLLHTLIDQEYAVQNSDTKRYGPGPKLLLIAEQAKSSLRFKPRAVVRPFLHDLARETGENVNYSVPQNGEIVYVEQVPSPRRVRMFTEVGHRAPLYCTAAGKVMLAYLPKHTVDTYLDQVPLERRTATTLTSFERLRKELKLAGSRGFAIDNQEFEQGVRCVAAPIMDIAGTCVGAISVSGPASRLTLQQAQILGPTVCGVAARCSENLGYSKHPHDDGTI